MDNEVEQACALVDDWQVTSELYDLSPEAWQYIKDKGFLGMIIPKRTVGWSSPLMAIRRLSPSCRRVVGAGGIGDGAELARARRTAAALWNRSAEEPLSAAPGQGARDSCLSR
jgi:alkylation response protein AidB-like acyl-CoA dehydrogenase